MSFDRVVLSTDENRNYLEFWPLTARAWEKFYGITPDLAFVTEREASDQLVKEMRECGNVVLYRPYPGIHPGNLGMIARYFLAASFRDDVCLIHDIDTVPLESSYYIKMTGKRDPGRLLTLGKEVYDQSGDKSLSGKFPISGMTGEGALFARLFNLDVSSEEDVIDELRFIKSYDEKETIEAPNGNTYGYGGTFFCDESLMRALFDRLKPHEYQHINREVDPRSDWIDRAWWEIDQEKLSTGGYIEANLLRPFSMYLEALSPIVEYIFDGNGGDAVLEFWRDTGCNF